MDIDVAEATFTATTTMSALLPPPHPTPHPLPAAALIKMDEPSLTITLITGPAMLVALGIYAYPGMDYAGDAMQSLSVEVISNKLQETL